MRKLLFFLFVSMVSTATTASALTLSLINLPNPVGGRDNVIQVTGALTGNVQGGPVTGDTQTIYYWANDGANTAPQYGLTASRSGGERTAWPVVFVPSGTSVTVGEGITASVSLGASQQVNPYDAALPSPLYTTSTDTAQPLLINNRPVYFFTPENGSSFSRNGVYGTWYALNPSGADITSASAGSSVPEPSTALLLGLGFAGLGLAGRRRSN